MYATTGESAFIIEGSGTFSGHNENQNAKSLELRGFNIIEQNAFIFDTKLINVSFDNPLMQINNNFFLIYKLKMFICHHHLQIFL